MKQKKKWVIPLCVIGVILLLCAGGLWYMINHSMSFSVGRCLVADNGSIWLLPANPDYQPIDGRECEVLGKVVAVVRQY